MSVAKRLSLELSNEIVACYEREVWKHELAVRSADGAASMAAH